MSSPALSAPWRVLVPPLALAAALALSSCQAEVPEDQRTATALPSPTSAQGSLLPAAEGTHSVADAMFAEMMRVHHEQALTLSELILAKPGIDERVRALAERIKAAQGPEIDQMRGWLAGWGIEPGSLGEHAAHMDGMVSASDLAQLEAAGAPEGQRLFLASMIEHHEGAVKMAEDELKLGTNLEAKELSRQIVAAQEREIAEMKKLLDALPGA